MPKKNFENIGVLQDYDTLQGVITDTPNTSDDTCTVLVAGASYPGTPIFYHCTEDATIRSNGAIKGAATGFAKNDSVIVLKQISGSEILVIGHLDGIRKCRSGGIMLVQLWDLNTANWQYLFYDLINQEVFSVSDIDGSTITQPFLLADLTASSIAEIEERNNLAEAARATLPTLSVNTYSPTGGGFTILQGGFDEFGEFHFPYEIERTWVITIHTPDKSIILNPVENKYYEYTLSGFVRTITDLGSPSDASYDDFDYMESAYTLGSDDWSDSGDIIKYLAGNGVEITGFGWTSCSIDFYPFLSDSIINVFSWNSYPWYPNNPPAEVYPHQGQTISNGNLWYQGRHALLVDGYSFWVGLPSTMDAMTKCYFYFQQRDSIEDKFSKAAFTEPVTDEQLYILFGTTKAAHLALSSSFVPGISDYQTFDRFGIRATKLYYGE